MRRIVTLLPVLLLGQSAHGSTAFGDLNNFDVINDTGQTCHGFLVELDDLHSTDITYTYDWNHYGVPRIAEDNSDPAHPKVFVYYESKKNSDGTFAAFTNPQDPNNPLLPTDGHACTDPSVNLGCEHFGVGFMGAPTLVKYNWLIEDALSPGNLTLGPVVNVATPTFVYVPPVPPPVNPGDPPAAPAQVHAVIAPPAPENENPNQFGVPVWVKVFKTTQPSGHKIELHELVTDDETMPGDPNWKGEVEAPETEIEWMIFQKRPANNPGDDEIAGADDLPNGDETVTRRYEFYVYNGEVVPEDGEAMCDNPDNCPDAVGAYIGAQMAGFNVVSPLGLIDNLQDGDVEAPYVDRTVVAGGNTPYQAAVINGALPDGLNLDPAAGILSGTPAASGVFAFSVDAADADLAHVTKQYVLNIAAPLSTTRSGFRYNRATHRFVQKVTVSNAGGVALSGPVSLVVKNLSANVSVFNKTGNTAATPPLGSPYINATLGGAGCEPGQTVTVTLEFDNPANNGIVYDAHVQTGPGGR